LTEQDKFGAAYSTSVYRPKSFYLAATALIIAIFTGVIVYGVQTVLGGNVKPDEGIVVDGVRTFNITEEQWAFQPAAFKVNPGEKVRFYVTSKDVWHGFAINELKINLTVPGGKTVQINAVVPEDATGQIYTMYCSVFCGIGHPYFKGQIIVGNPKLLFGIGLAKLMPYAATLTLVVIFAVAVVMERRRVK